MYLKCEPGHYNKEEELINCGEGKTDLLQDNSLPPSTTNGRAWQSLSQYTLTSSLKVYPNFAVSTTP